MQMRDEANLQKQLLVHLSRYHVGVLVTHLAGADECLQGSNKEARSLSTDAGNA